MSDLKFDQSKPLPDDVLPIPVVMMNVTHTHLEVYRGHLCVWPMDQPETYPEICKLIDERYEKGLC